MVDVNQETDSDRKQIGNRFRQAGNTQKTDRKQTDRKQIQKDRKTTDRKQA